MLLLIFVGVVGGMDQNEWQNCTLRLFSHRRMVSIDAGMVNAEGLVDDIDVENATMLCRVLLPGTQQREQPTNHALVTFSTTFKYLASEIKRNKGEEMDLWEAFLAKCEYARRAGLDFYLFVSDMPSSAGRHYLKILGVRALLERESPSSYASVTYADADSVPSDSTLSPVDYLNIGGDLIGSSNVQHIPIVMNGGIWIARNTPTARSILQSWWELRRGPKDQLALWETLFRHWRMRQGQGLFDDYENAQANALYYFVRERQRLGGRDCADSSTRCGSVLRQTGCLTQPFLVDSVLLLPVVPFFHESSSEPLPPIQTEYHASGWWCHKTCSLLHNQSSSDELLQTTHPPRSSLRRRRRHLASSPFTEPNDTTTNAPSVSSSCVASHIRAFVCPCGHILTKLAALNWCGGDEGSAVDAECVEVAAQNVSKSRLRIERHRKKQAIH